MNKKIEESLRPNLKGRSLTKELSTSKSMSLPSFCLVRKRTVPDLNPNLSNITNSLRISIKSSLIKIHLRKKSPIVKYYYDRKTNTRATEKT